MTTPNYLQIFPVYLYDIGMEKKKVVGLKGWKNLKKGSLFGIQIENLRMWELRLKKMGGEKAPRYVRGDLGNS